MNLFVRQVGWWLGIALLCACTENKPELLEPNEADFVKVHFSSSSAKVPDFPVKENPNFVFSEVDPINIVYEDDEGGDAGWVEIINKSSRTVDLSGY